MWEGIDKDQTTYNKLTLIVEGMSHNTLLWVTDGLYNRKRSAGLSGVGWVIMCTKDRKQTDRLLLETVPGIKLVPSRITWINCASYLSKGY